MILYASPLACSGAVQMVMFELDLPHETRFVDIYAQPHVLIDDRSTYAAVNPKNAVPALRLASGEVLTEVGVILQYVADSRPGSDLLPAPGTLARYRVLEWLSYVGSDVHKTIGPLFHPHMPEEAKAIHRQNLGRRLAYIEGQLAHRAPDCPYLTGAAFTVADAYLFVLIGWEPYFKFDLAPYPHLARFQERVAARPSFARLRQCIDPVLGLLKLPSFPARARNAEATSG